MRTLLLALVLAACTTPPVAESPAVDALPEAPPGDDVTVAGEVVSVDLEPLAYDGNAVLVLRTDAGERRVEIPARTNLCQADGLGEALDARPGERLTVVGAEPSPGGAIVPCSSAAHRVRRG